MNEENRVIFAFIKLSIQTQWKNLLVCFLSMNILLMLFQQWLMSNNFYTVSSTVQIYLTKGNSVYSNYNVGDASKSLNYNRTESMNLKIMNQEKNNHRA